MSDQSAGGFKGEQSDVSVLQTATVTCADALTPERSDVHVFKGLLVKSSATHACDAPRQLLFLTTSPSPIEETDPQDIDVNSITEDTRISYLLHADPDVMDGEVGLLIPTPPSFSPRMLSAFSRVHGAPRDSSQVLTTGTTRRHASRTTRLSLQPMKMGWQHGGYVRSWNYHKEICCHPTRACATAIWDKSRRKFLVLFRRSSLLSASGPDRRDSLHPCQRRARRRRPNDRHRRVGAGRER